MSTSSSLDGPQLPSNKHEILRDEMSNDSLLKIMNGDFAKNSNNIILAAENGNLSIIQSAIDCGYDLTKCKGMNGYTPIHYASSRGHIAVVSLLLRCSLPVNIKNAEGETALHLAVYCSNILIVEQLIDYGADIDALNEYGESPLFYAARRNSPAIVRLLLQRGADANIKDEFGECAIDHANDERLKAAFETCTIMNMSPNSSSQNNNCRNISHVLSFDQLLMCLLFLEAKEVCKCACVSGKFHRVSESEIIWNRLGIRRWELALQSTLGFKLTAASNFGMPVRRSSKDSKFNANNLKSRPSSKEAMKSYKK